MNKIPIFSELVGIEKRVQDLQQNISELDWLEYSFGLAKRVMRGDEDNQRLVPVVYTGAKSDSLDMTMWPDDVYKAYAFWDLINPSEYLYFDNVNARRRFPKIEQPVALIVCLDNQKISPNQDNNVTHSICREELINKLNNKNMSQGIFQIAAVVENRITDVFDEYDVEDNLQEPWSCLRIEGLLTYTKDC